MQIAKIRDMSDGEIRSAIDDLREELFNLRVQAGIGTLEDLSRMREARRDLARMLTVLRERELAAELVSAGQKEEA
ncbi:MAG: 50S ribosomal protein L29 [Anaerolineae bacterium]|nr:50S ribosomal protein L29 [Anaerolineae bacterium]